MAITDSINSVINLMPGWVKLLVFLFLIPIFASLIVSILINPLNYMCDTHGNAYILNTTALAQNTDPFTSTVASGGVAVEGVFKWATDNLVSLLGIGSPQEERRQSLVYYQTYKDYREYEDLRLTIVGLKREGNLTTTERNVIIIDNATCDLFNDKCMNYTSGRVLNSTEYDSEYGTMDSWFNYGQCVKYSPRTYEDTNVTVYDFPSGCGIIYAKDNQTIENLEIQLNDIVESIGYRDSGGIERQIFPVMCSKLSPTVTLFGIPLFSDFRIIFMLYFVYFLSGIYVYIRQIQPKR